MNNKIIWLALLGLSVAGCAPSGGPTVGPWGYDFKLTRVEDARPDDDAKLMAADPFSAEKFNRAWQQAVARPVWGAVPGQLAVRLKSYEATQSGPSYALSMEVDLVGRAGDPAPSYRLSDVPVVATVAAQCTAYGTNTGGAGGSALFRQITGTAKVPQPGGKAAPTGLGALTPEARDATLWQEIWQQCVGTLATQFGNQLLAGPAMAPYRLPF